MIANQIPIYFDRKGSGQPCFLLHGGPGMDSSYFSPYLDPLSNIFQLYSIDLRGCGNAPRLNQQEYTIPLMLDDLHQLQEQEKHEQVFLLGHSFGAVLALEYALKFPEKVRALILIATAVRSEFIQTTLRNAKRFPSVAAAQRKYALSARKDADFAELVFNSIPLYFSPGFEEQALAMLKKIQFGADCYAAVSQKLLSNFNLLPRLHEIQVPVFVMGAGADLVTPPEFTHEIAERIPHASYHEITGAGHFPFFEQPEKCISMIKNWYASLSS